jgi:cell division protein FtsB
MLEFVLKYWIEFLFGLVIAVGSFMIKRTLQSYRQERADEKESLIAGIKAEIRAEFERSNKKENELAEQIKVLKAGLLSIQGRTFKSNCRRLLDPDHEISLEEYEEITKDHDAYNSLGGNHNGDQLYMLVRKKVEDSWAKDKI